MRTHRLPVTPRPIASFKRHSMALGVRLSFSTITGLLTAGQASAQAPEAGVRYDIPAGPLDEALSRFAQQSGAAIVMDAAKLRSLSSSGLRGDYGVEEGFNRLLLGSGYTLGKTKAGYIVIEAPGASQGAATVLPAVKVEAQSDRLFDPPPEQGGFKADFQESATKTPLSIRETPQSISVITRESMDARQVPDIETALELSAGVKYNSGSGAFAGQGLVPRDALILRGQVSERANRIDGFLSVDIGVLDTALFERVEYVKGPSSTLYGPGPLAGFINRVSKKPKSEREAHVSTSIGSFDTKRVEADVGGGLGDSGAVTTRVVAILEDSGSFVDGVEQKKAVLAPSVGFRLGERTQLLVQGIYQDGSGVPNSGLPAIVRLDGELVLPNVPRSFVNGAPGSGSSDTQFGSLSARLDHELSDRWLASLLLQGNSAKSDNSLGFYGYGLYEDGQTAALTGISNADQDIWTGELQLQGRFDLWGRSHQLTLGTDMRRLNANFEFAYASLGRTDFYANDFAFTPPEELTAIAINPPDRDTRGAFGQVVFSVTDRTRLLAGLRYDRSETEPASTADPLAKESAVTYRVGLTQDLTRNLTAFGIYSTSFIPVLDRAPDGDYLDPETGNSLEFGFKGEWFDQRLSASTAVYRQDRDKVPLGLPREECLAGGAGLMFCSTSAGLQRADGIEVEVSGKPTSALTLGFAGSWIDSEFVERSDPNFGFKTPRTVERQINVYASYKFMTGPMQGLNLGTTVVSQGEQGGTRVNQYIKGYERVDLHFGYDAIPQWNFRLLVRNLFDERYINSSDRDPGWLNFVGSPRAALLQAGYEFKL